MLPEKMTGVFEHHILKPSSPLVRGFDDVVYAPHSRYTGVKAEDIAAKQDLELIAVSDEAGVFIAKSTNLVISSCSGTPNTTPTPLQMNISRCKKGT